MTLETTMGEVQKRSAGRKPCRKPKVSLKSKDIVYVEYKILRVNTGQCALPGVSTTGVGMVSGSLQ